MRTFLVLWLLSSAAVAQERPPPQRHVEWLTFVKPPYCPCTPPAGLVNQLLDPQWRAIDTTLEGGLNRHQSPSYASKVVLFELDF